MDSRMKAGRMFVLLKPRYAVYTARVKFAKEKVKSIRSYINAPRTSHWGIRTGTTNRIPDTSDNMVLLERWEEELQQRQNRLDDHLRLIDEVLNSVTNETYRNVMRNDMFSDKNKFDYVRDNEIDPVSAFQAAREAEDEAVEYLRVNYVLKPMQT